MAPKGRAANSELLEAARDGNLRGATRALESGADVDAREAGGYTALHHAARRGDLPLARLVLDRGANPNVVTRPEGQHPPELPLTIAAERDDLPWMQLLLDAGADPNGTTGVSRRMPQALDARFVPLFNVRSPRAAELLLRRGAAPNGPLAAPKKSSAKPRKRIPSPLAHHATRFGPVEERVAIVEVLFSHGASFDACGNGPSVLARAVEAQSLPLVSLLLDRGVRFEDGKVPQVPPGRLRDRLERAGLTAAAPASLGDAVRAENLEWIRQWWEREGSRRRDPWKEPSDAEALEDAMERPASLLALIELGALDGLASRHYFLKQAVRRGWLRIIQALEARGTPLDTKDDYGRGLLEDMAKAREPSLEVCAHLLRVGLDPTEVWKNRYAERGSPLSGAVFNDNEEVFELMLAHGGRSLPEASELALGRALRRGAFHIADKLWERGVRLRPESRRALEVADWTKPEPRDAAFAWLRAHEEGSAKGR